MARFALTVAFLSVFATPAWATEPEEEPLFLPDPASQAFPFVTENYFGMQYRFWWASLSGEMTVDGDTLLGTSVDVETALGLTKREAFHDVSGWAHLPLIGNFRGSWWFGEFKREKNIAQALNFGNTTFAAATTIRSKLELNFVTVLYEYPLVAPAAWGMQMEGGVHLGGKYISASGSLDTGVGNVEKDSLRGAVPVIGGRLVWGGADLYTFEIEFNGLAVNYNDVTVRLIDAQFEFTVTPWQGFFGGIGYRMVDLVGKDEGSSRNNVDVELSVEGIFLTAGWSF